MQLEEIVPSHTLLGSELSMDKLQLAYSPTVWNLPFYYVKNGRNISPHITGVRCYSCRQNTVSHKEKVGKSNSSSA